MNARWTFNLVLFLSAMMNLFGQQGTSSLTGTVVDPTGAVVPNASARLTNSGNGAVRTLETRAAGEFRFDALTPGEYKLEVTSKGFKTLIVDQIALLSSETRGLGNLTIQVGTASESISVTAEITPVQTASSEQSQSINSDQLNRVTLKGRDPFGYLRLLSGVLDTNNDRNLITNQGAASGISVNGMDGNHNQTSIDGAPTAHMACNACFAFVVPNVDSIAEVRVLQNGIQAEFGRIAGGGQINFVTKSGTSAFHGSANWNHRNESLNANTFFNNRSNLPRQTYRYLTLGGSIGGPIFIPKLMPAAAKGKFFFFYSPEYATSKQPTNQLAVNAPTALERSGDFSQTFYASNAAPTVPIRLTIIDPTTGQPFPNNVIPSSRIDRTGQGLLNLLPAPNGYVPPALPYTANSLFAVTPTFFRLNNMARIDGNLTSKLSAYYRLAIDRTVLDNVNQVTAGVGTTPYSTPGSTHVAHATYVANPTTVLELQFTSGNTYGIWKERTDITEQSLYRTSALNPPRIYPLPTANNFNGFTPRFGYSLYAPFLPAATFTGGLYQGFTSFNPGATRTRQAAGDDQYTWRADLSKTWGSHAFKLGYYWEWSFDFDSSGGGNYNGAYNFGSTPNNPLDTGSGYSNALLGVFQQYSQASVRTVQERYFTMHQFYVQDNWKVNRRLTLDYGVRFYHQSPTWDTAKGSTSFVRSSYDLARAPRVYAPACRVAGATCAPANQYAVDPVTGNTNLISYVGNLVPGVGSPTNGILYPNPYGLTYQALGVQPRFGFAYNVGGDGKTAIRGSAGIFQSAPNLNNLNYGANAPVSYAGVVSYSTLGALAADPNVGIISPTANSIYPKQKLEGIYQYNLFVERAVGFSTVASVGYVGNFSRHAQQTQAVNNVPLGAYALQRNVFSGTPVNANLLRAPYTGMGNINLFMNGISGVNYHGLQSSLKRRFSNGFTYTATYTFSKSLGTTGFDPYHTGQPVTTAFGTTVTLLGQRQRYYGPTAQDRRHFGSVNFTYSIPGFVNSGIPKRLALSGWTLSGVTNFSTGAPVSPTCNSNASFPFNDPSWSGAATNTAATNVRCQVVGDRKDFTQSFDTNFNKAAFGYPSGGTQAAPVINFGNAGLNILRQPGFWNQDVTLAKDFPLGEGRRLSANIQAYNVFNHTQFNTIGTTYLFNNAGVNTNATTGQFTNTNAPRQIALSARFQF